MDMEKINQYLKDIRQDVSFISPDVLVAIPYNRKQKDTWVEINNPEFTSLCPETGLPDYGIIHIRYLPDRYIVELKSLKYYFLQFRNTGIFYEHLTPLIMEHLKSKIYPQKITVTAQFTSRGGIASKIVSSSTED